MENITLIFPGFIVAILIVLIYEYKITQICKEPRNKVRFYVTKVLSEYNHNLHLYVGKNWDLSSFVCTDFSFDLYNLNPEDFADMKYGEIREVFINLED